MNTRLAPRLEQIGRIRIGDQKGDGRDKRRKLDTFRLTVPYQSKPILEFAAGIYGGTVQQWENPMEGRSWELYTSVNSLKVYVIPNQCVATGCERWTAAGIARRCDGEIIQFDTDEQLIGTACECPEDHETRQALALKGKACVDKTRISVMLQDLPAIGLWRLDTQGYYAATNALGQIMLLQSLGITQPVEAILSMGQGKRKRWNTEKGKHETRIFPTVLLTILVTPKQLVQELPAGPMRPALPPGPPAAVAEIYGEEVEPAVSTAQPFPAAAPVAQGPMGDVATKAALLNRCNELRQKKGIHLNDYQGDVRQHWGEYPNGLRVTQLEQVVHWLETGILPADGEEQLTRTETSEEHHE